MTDYQIFCKAYKHVYEAIALLKTFDEDPGYDCSFTIEALVDAMGSVEATIQCLEMEEEE